MSTVWKKCIDDFFRVTGAVVVMCLCCVAGWIAWRAFQEKSDSCVAVPIPDGLKGFKAVPPEDYPTGLVRMVCSNGEEFETWMWEHEAKILVPVNPNERLKFYVRLVHRDFPGDMQVEGRYEENGREEFTKLIWRKGWEFEIEFQPGEKLGKHVLELHEVRGLGCRERIWIAVGAIPEDWKSVKRATWTPPKDR